MMYKNRIALFSVIFCLLFLRVIKGKKCNFNVQVEQILFNEGFHRNLSIEIDFASGKEDERWLYEDCLLGIEQTLPSGVYATLEEIVDSDCKSLIHTIFKTPVNVEMPAQKSEPIVVHLLGKVQDYGIHIYIPVHARYHLPVSGGGMARNNVPIPKLYLMCPNNKLEQCEDLYSEVSGNNNFCEQHVSQEACTWKEIPIIMLTAPIIWETPMGNTDHHTIVALGTIAIVVAGSLYLLNHIHHYKMKERNKKRL